MTDIIWQDPPLTDYERRTARALADTPEFVDALKARPGEWALYPVPLSHLDVEPFREACKSAYGVYLELKFRDRPNGYQRDMYARWIGRGA